jgi:hypothetical protein
VVAEKEVEKAICEWKRSGEKRVLWGEGWRGEMLVPLVGSFMCEERGRCRDCKQIPFSAIRYPSLYCAVM